MDVVSLHRIRCWSLASLFSPVRHLDLVVCQLCNCQEVQEMLSVSHECDKWISDACSQEEWAEVQRAVRGLYSKCTLVLCMTFEWRHVCGFEPLNRIIWYLLSPTQSPIMPVEVITHPIWLCWCLCQEEKAECLITIDVCVAQVVNILSLSICMSHWL